MDGSGKYLTPIEGTVSGAEDRIAYAGHSDGIKPTLTVAENLNFWAKIFAAPDIAPALTGFDLTHLADRPAGALSAGQKRRLGLARLMVASRPFWILDEPTVSLDRTSVALFADRVQAHLGQGGSAVLATHIDLGLSADTLDIGQFKARPQAIASSDEAFL